jgi:hypothetical protein
MAYTARRQRRTSARAKQVDTQSESDEPRKVARPKTRKAKHAEHIEGAHAKHHLGKRARGGTTAKIQHRYDGGEVLNQVSPAMAAKVAGEILGTPGDAYNMLYRGFQYGLTEGARQAGLLRPGEAEQIRRDTASPDEPRFGSAAITHWLNGKLGAQQTQPADTDADDTRRRGGRTAQRGCK